MSNAAHPRVLVVEDEPTINQAVTDRLTAEGFAVRQEYDGPGAVDAARDWHPQLVVLDVMLPGVGLRGVARSARRPRARAPAGPGRAR